MRIVDLMATSGPFISLEFFPPKEKDKWPDFFAEVDKLKVLAPMFVSVTYGAGGSTRDFTLEIVTRMKQELGLEPMAHLTCVGASKQSIGEYLTALQNASINNVLALRGDPPKGQETFVPDSEDFQHASDLVEFMAKEFPAMGAGVACYPEKHQEATSLADDIRFLKDKLDKGAQFAVCQLFFDNSHYFAFVDKCRDAGITQPIVPGILPVLGPNTLKRAVSLSGSSIPEGFIEALEAAEAKGGVEAAKDVGIAHARAQIEDLLTKGAPGVHLYTLNKAEACLRIMDGIKLG
ncbi:MAG: methylenetetrahydrofolate reductase [NAD(P)H] [Desulfovibrio sp.]|nr:MAG: methylenetetrahydrofolate reductase [NAD(P)H] [Desulfovibrio sp.]